jgi:L-arabinokinase
VDAEWRWLHHAGARVILGDVPPLAFEAASEVGVPSIALANFSWDWIYRHLARAQAALAAAADWAAAAYARAGLLLRLPFAGGLSAFPKAVDIPLVARRPRVTRVEARRRLGLGAGPVALVSFGGVGLGSFALRVLGGIGEIQFVAVGLPGPAPPNVRLVTAAEMAGLGLRYEDAVGAADVVVTKPGYGIVSDAIAAGVRIVYTERGDFPEYPVLVAEMVRYVPAAHVSNADLLGGRLRDPIRAVLAQPIPPPPDLSGAAAAAEWLLETAARSA